jgi:hypothetical protein
LPGMDTNSRDCRPDADPQDGSVPATSPSPVGVKPGVVAGSRFRRYALFAAAAAGVILAAWMATRLAFRRPAVDAASLDSLAAVPADGVKGAPVPTEGFINVRVTVKVVDGRGMESPVGTILPSRLVFKLYGAGGQEYEAGFDRVGVWVMEIPPGEYSAPAKQAGMGEWRWKVAGSVVRATRDGYAFTVPPGSAPAVELTLR